MSRPRIEWRAGTKESWNTLKKQHPKLKKYEHSNFLNVLYTFNQILVDYVLETGNLVRFPFGMGHLSINKYKRSYFRKNKDNEQIINLKPDWNKTMTLWKECPECKEQKKLVYHTNTHTDGFSYYWMWIFGSNMLFGRIWKFDLNRVHSRRLAALLKEPHSKYKNLYNFYHK